jgi:PAS domain S-box-containing protein
MKREQFLLQPPARISPEFQPDGQRSAEAAPKMIALAYRNGLHRFDWTCVNAEGGEFIVEVSLMPIVIKGRTLLHTTWRDVTKRKQIEDALRISEQRFRDVSEAAGEYLWEIDANMVYTYVSNRSIDVKGYSPEELLGHTPMEFMPEEDVGPVGEIINRAIANKAPFKLQHRDITKSGAVLWEEVNGIPFYDADGTVIGLRGAGMNITERKMSEQALTEAMHKLEEKELSKSRFFAAAGHDLRQPLTAANLFLDAIKRTKPTPKQDKIIERLDHTMSIFKGQLNSLLDIARLDSGTIKPEYEPINVTEFFNLLESTFTTISSDKQVGLRLHYPMKETLIVLGDIGLLNSVLMNLVSNAIKFTSKGGAILISARKRRYEVLFQVWDTGMGILEEHLEQIFDEFYQINNPQRDRSEGLGLGLSIAKRAITLIDSKITCHSKIGRGSVFEFRLPLDGVLRGKKQEAAIEALQEDEASLPFVQGKRFVAVEDDLLVAQALTQALEGLGGEVECFHSAEDALRHSNIGYADCYIIDYRLGGTLNGIQFLNTLRQKLDKPINAVLVTGDTSPTFIREAANFVWPVLHKPVNTAKLISTLSVQERKHV